MLFRPLLLLALVSHAGLLRDAPGMCARRVTQMVAQAETFTVNFDGITHLEEPWGGIAWNLFERGVLTPSESIGIPTVLPKGGGYSTQQELLGEMRNLAQYVQGATHLQLLIRWSKELSREWPGLTAESLFLALINPQPTTGALAMTHSLSAAPFVGRRVTGLFGGMYDIANLFDRSTWSSAEREIFLAAPLTNGMNWMTWYLRGPALPFQGLITSTGAALHPFGKVDGPHASLDLMQMKFRVPRPLWMSGRNRIQVDLNRINVVTGHRSLLMPAVAPVVGNRGMLIPNWVMAQIYVDNKFVGGLYSVSEPTAKSILATLWHYEQVMEPVLEREGIYQALRRFQKMADNPAEAE